ncbi:MAG: IS1634 family transposase [Candidatus Dadabacteria bacterium]|nr:IS1634 family transposase [Candidatus Dadabacteria bacterium]
MYLDTAKYKKSGKIYTRYLLRESYRQGTQIKKRTIASITKCSPDEIKAIKLALKHKNNLSVLGSFADVQVKQEKSIGALLALQAVYSPIKKALSSDEQGRIALWQVWARLIDQGSRCSALRLLDTHLGREQLQLPDTLTLYRVYKNLEWLCKHQESIEQRLWKSRGRDKTANLFLYDVTSSYLEGKHNELGSYGYNRDKKSGKKQIVIGLLTDNEGDPIAVRVFKGNTSDCKTVQTQIDALKNQFKVKEVTIVGDRAMFKLPQIAELPENFNYISALTKTDIRTLLKSEVIQLELFDTELCEVEDAGGRYILRRNPIRAKEIEQVRKEKLEKLQSLIEEKNTYLSTHIRATEKVALKELQAKAEKLKINTWMTISVTDRVIKYEIDTTTLEEVSHLDGCYCLKTNLSTQTASKEIVNDRYGDLQLVEAAFRTMKQSHLELRPIYLRREDHTRGHVFIVMLAYLLQRKLKKAWEKTDRTVQECLDILSTLTTTILEMGDIKVSKLPQPNAECRQLLMLVGAKLPKSI